MSNPILSIFRTIVGYFLLLFLSRLMGRKMISQMTFFDFVVGVTVGTVLGTIAIGADTSFINTTIVLIVLAILTLILDFAHIKSYRVRKLLNSEPLILINKGNIVNQNLEKIRMTINELTMMLREKDVFNIGDVEYAILEHDGQISVLPKSSKQPVTPSDLNLTSTYKGLTRDIIIDGNIMIQNLAGTNMDKNSLLNALKLQGIKDVKEVFYAGLDSSQNLYVSLKSDSKEKEGKYGIE